jgi:hypothetical protein
MMILMEIYIRDDVVIWMILNENYRDVLISNECIYEKRFHFELIIWYSMEFRKKKSQ